MTAKRIIGWLLLAFVVASICVAAGNEIVAERKARRASSASGPRSEAAKVVVYYLHGTYRCPACNWIESAGKQFVQREIGDSGRVEWRALDYQQDDALARRYDVAGNMIVVASFRNGREAAARRLTRVMEISGRTEEFEAHLRQAVADLQGEKP